MNYLIRLPRKEFDYELVFQANPMNYPPVPSGHDVVVACDTDARMNWEWHYMREISNSEAGKDVEAAFHIRETQCGQKYFKWCLKEEISCIISC